MTGADGSLAGRFIEDLTWPEVAEAFRADRPVAEDQRRRYAQSSHAFEPIAPADARIFLGFHFRKRNENTSRRQARGHDQRSDFSTLALKGFSLELSPRTRAFGSALGRQTHA